MVRIAYGIMLVLMVMIHPTESKPRVVMIRTRPRDQERCGEESSYQLVTEKRHSDTGRGFEQNVNPFSEETIRPGAGQKVTVEFQSAARAFQKSLKLFRLRKMVRMCSWFLTPVSLQNIPEVLKRCPMSFLQPASTMPDPIKSLARR